MNKLRTEIAVIFSKYFCSSCEHKFNILLTICLRFVKNPKVNNYFVEIKISGTSIS